ncbi:hypothetical protein BC826DRAFT_1036201 [Russula brevipes]|nr:hypothetical protein BC826DRAFT_1036201 [Russula brevipes]
MCHTQTLVGNLSPRSGGPPLSPSPKSRPNNEAVQLVLFAHRPRTSSGAFYDYTARHCAVGDEDRVSLRQSMFPERIRPCKRL